MRAARRSWWRRRSPMATAAWWRRRSRPRRLSPATEPGHGRGRPPGGRPLPAWPELGGSAFDYHLRPHPGLGRAEVIALTRHVVCVLPYLSGVVPAGVCSTCGSMVYAPSPAFTLLGLVA